jgi:hypothetical protein
METPDFRSITKTEVEEKKEEKEEEKEKEKGEKEMKEKERAKKKRARKPKVRTGCITCKAESKSQLLGVSIPLIAMSNSSWDILLAMSNSGWNILPPKIPERSMLTPISWE